MIRLLKPLQNLSRVCDIAPTSQGRVAFTSTQPLRNDSQHWLDRFTGLRDWLDAANRRWWIHSVCKARCAQHQELHGHRALISQALHDHYDRLWERHEHVITDSRSRVHLASACLAAATHRALLPFLRDEREVLKAVREHMGARTDPLLMWV
jgi:hypothetical protein